MQWFLIDIWDSRCRKGSSDTEMRPCTGSCVVLEANEGSREEVWCSVAYGNVAYGNVAYGIVAYGNVAYGIVAYGNVAYGNVAYGIELQAHTLLSALCSFSLAVVGLRR